jgi:glycosyltransferase involved in cell wall biosynthesis
MRKSHRTWETIVIDDGGGDFGGIPFDNESHATLIELPRNRGKGAAVAAGMLAATGRVRIFTDVDLPYGLAPVPLIVEAVERRGFHLVIGDRTLPSALFTEFVGRLVTGGFFDTQCGLKAVRGDVADTLFHAVRIERFAFDVELVYVALKHRADIHRIPVRLIRNDTSSVRLVRDSVRGVVDVFRIKLHQLRGHYAVPALADVLHRDRASAAASAHDAWNDSPQSFARY